MLDAIARTLLLDQHERAAPAHPGRHRPADAAAECAAVGPRSLAILAQLSPFPACRPERARTTCSRTTATYGRLVGDLDTLPAGGPQPALAGVHPPELARALPGLGGQRPRAWSRSSARRWPSTWPTRPGRRTLRRLREGSAEFRELWAEHEVERPSDNPKGYVNERVGVLHMQHTSLWLNPRGGSRMVVYTPLDEETRARLSRLLLPADAEPAARPVPVAV